MLILTRNRGEKIRIGDDIEVVILDLKGGQARVGVQAPSHMPVHRQEVYERIQKEKRA